MTKTKELSLKPRLSTVADFIKPCDTIADIGCDHGRLSVTLLRMGKAKKIIASDISKPSLEKAELLAKKCHLSDKINVVVSDGLSHIMPNDNIDAIVIAGMGGELISSILQNGETAAKKASQIVLQPMGGIEELRKFIAQEGYIISDERLVFDAGRFYQIIKICYAENPPQKQNGFLGDYWSLGCMLFEKKDPLLLSFLERREAMLSKELARAGRDGHEPEVLTTELEHVKKLLSLLN